MSCREIPEKPRPLRWHVRDVVGIGPGQTATVEMCNDDPNCPEFHYLIKSDWSE